MNPLLHGSLALAQKILRRLKERAGLVSGFADVEMHLWMLSDEARAAAFERAIGTVVRPGDLVADVGTGTGLLAMMACRAGAGHVFAIEERPVIDLARTIIRENGFQDRVTLIRGNSRRVTLPSKVDHVVSETIGTFVFSEDILTTVVDGRDRFLKPAGSLIPERIRAFLAPVESFGEGIGFWERPLRGFDYSACRAAVAHETVIAARRITEDHFLAPAQAAYDIDLRTATLPQDLSRTLEYRALREGRLHGFVGFWEVSLHGEISLRCAPGAPPLHWTPVLFRLPEGLPVRRGERVLLRFGRRDRPGWSWRWEATVEPGSGPPRAEGT